MQCLTKSHFQYLPMPSKMTQVSRFSVILLLIDWQVVVDVVLVMLLFLTQKWLVRLRNILAGLHFAASVGSWGVLVWAVVPRCK